MTKVLIGLPMEDSVKAEFFTSFFAAVNLLPQEGTFVLNISKWRNIVKTRNDMVKEAIKGYSHLFFMDSDMMFPENTLSRLLRHDLDIVGGLYTVKLPPYNTTIFRNNGKLWQSYNPSVGEGLIEVEGIGTGCLLIKTDVLKKMDWPYFWYAESPDEKENMMTEDVYFCIEAKKKGYRIHCDTSVHCGHVGNGMVTIEEKDDLKVRIQMV